MPADIDDLVIRVAGLSDSGEIALLWSRWRANRNPDPDFTERMAAWHASEGSRRTTWLAVLGEVPVGIASLFEYRRMPHPDRADSSWGYVGNMFVSENVRNYGIGSALLEAIISTADDRGYARLVLSPSPRSVPFYARAGFIVPDGVGAARLLVRPGDGG
jgi:GNAT superfamily N-acetyltransferase